MGRGGEGERGRGGEGERGRGGGGRGGEGERGERGRGERGEEKKERGRDTCMIKSREGSAVLYGCGLLANTLLNGAL